jgi:hypothetical protein
MFQKRHYKAIADLVKNEIAGAYKATVAHVLADAFERDNPLFNRKRFYDACGLVEMAKEVKE